MKKTLELVIFVGLSELAGIVGSVFTMPQIDGWYATLAKPALTPPAWVFAPVWSTLFLLMGIAAFLVWDNYSLPRTNRRIVFTWKLGIWLFFLQLILNMLWSFIFFGMQNPFAAFVEILFLWMTIFAMLVAFAKISKAAAWLLAPYILWVSFAAYLNYSLWMLN